MTILIEIWLSLFLTFTTLHTAIMRSYERQFHYKGGLGH